ncbi:DUF4336 domain-containing protein [Lichenicola cladoniae]|nr:DUF4336 domain-containing protein [Lichenicola cladoniae]
MIPTRMHGAIDYGVACLLGGLATSRALPAPIRGVLATAATFHSTYATLTNYEAGLRPVLSMRQHLALDALGGAAVAGAGLLMHRQPWQARALLIAAGLSELAVVAASSATPVSGPGQGSGPVARVLGLTVPPAGKVGYPPIDIPKPVADDVFIVDSLLPGPMGTALPVRMTVIRLGNGDLLLHSPTQFSDALKTELEKIGRIRHLMAPNVAHWTFLEAWQRACPDVTTWSAPGLRERSQVKKSGVRLDHDLSSFPPTAWIGITLVEVVGGLGFSEIALFHQASRTLVLTDLVLNLEASKLPAPIRPLARLFGVTAPDGMPPPYLRAAIKRDRASATKAASRLLELKPERVIFAHGLWFERDATNALRRSLRWLLG